MPNAEPDRQMEIQLGHMCNNRCVFCVSGQRTAMREAFPIVAEPIVAKIRDAYAQGIRKLTILGGEPTIQPEFMTVVQAAVDLGFDEIVIFTNGVKTAREAFVDEVLATGGHFTWRLSFQGATGAAHDRTTKKLGSFQRLVQTMEHLRRKGQRLTVNMCVVRSNFESVPAFPELILPYGARQLHLDMIRPLDAGVRTEDEMRAMLPRYSDMVPALERMIAGFAPGFDVNIGNLPYCVAPNLAPWIHHDGEKTLTVAVDDRDQLSEPWDKYAVKRRDKLKLESCRGCVFDSQCSGFFETYRRFYGLDELVPITLAKLREVDPAMRLFAIQMQPFVSRLESWALPPRFETPTIRVNSHEREVTFFASGPGGAALHLALRPPGGGAAGTDRFSLHVLDARGLGSTLVSTLRGLLAHLSQGTDARLIHPVADDAASVSSTNARGMDWRIAECIARLRARAPFGVLSWTDVRVEGDGNKAAIELLDPDGLEITITLAVHGNQVASAYKLARSVAAPSAELVEGVRAAMHALRASD